MRVICTNEGTYERRYVRRYYLRREKIVPYFIRTNEGKNYRNAHTYIFICVRT